MKKIILAISALTLSASLAMAQEAATRQTFVYLSPSEAVAKVAKPGLTIFNLTPQNKNHDNFQIVQRDRTANAEIHMGAADFITIIGGSATIVIGGQVPDKHETGPGEFLGSKIVDGKTYTMTPGAMIVVPAGTPHWFNVPEGGHVVYTVTKHSDTAQ